MAALDGTMAVYIAQALRVNEPIRALRHVCCRSLTTQRPALPAGEIGFWSRTMWFEAWRAVH
jgi:hypothetical protein